MKIELENLFVQKLKDGINLFTGAGFSTLQSPNGEKLPTGKELCCELKKKYSLADIPEDQELSYVSEFCPEQEYQEYLRERLKVKSYNPLYNVLNKINLKSYITTNIDNIVRLVMDASTSYYLKSIQEYGASMHGANELPYIPLHGDISDLNSKLFFGKFDLSVVDKRNKDLFDQMFGLLAKQPILFWGYSFRDSGVLSTVKRLLELGSSDIWIQYNFEWAIEDRCQDFFSLRSKLFSISARNILIEEYKDDFAKTILSFISKESPYNIAKYNIYKRKGYDSDLFSKIFNREQASYLYDLIYNFDKSPYTLQQWALCLTAFKDYKEAFIKIDKAIAENPCNFSFKNSQAIIMFESNKEIGNTDAIDYMHKAMEILNQCYLNDKRKLYHAQKFAEFAIFFYTQYHYSDYLKDSKKWLLEVSESNEYTSSRTKKLVDKITTILSHL